MSRPDLASLLCEQISGEADFSAAGRALYACDASNYRQVPLGVVYPKTLEDIVTTTRLCRDHGLPVLMRGAGTSQNGQCVNVAVIMDCSRHLNQVHSLDPEQRTALVGPGVICDHLKAAAEPHGLTFGPDPATHSRCTLGGMIGNNSCGPHSMLAGKTVENVEALEILTYDGARFWVGATREDELERIIAGGGRQGEIYRELKAIRDEYADLIRERFPAIKRRVSGYNLDQLLPENGFHVARALVGSEGTCATVLQAKVRLIRNPRCKQLLVLGFADIYQAGDAVPEIMPFRPIAMEGLDWGIVGGLVARRLHLDDIALLPEGKAWLLTEIAADSAAELEQHCQAFMAAMQASQRVVSCLRVNDAATVKRLWSIREQGASATSMALEPGDIDPVVGWEDTAVDPYRLGDYLRGFQALVDRYGYQTSLYGHFGDGCIHARITFDTRSREGVSRWREFSADMAALVVEFGGSLSGEHGDGQAKAEFLPLMFGEELMQAFTRFKAAWDQGNRMNPGKLIHAYRMDENLRFGPDYQTATVHTLYRFERDVGGLGRSLERCIGMGKCRSHETAMCPSFQATGEERFSTRGRAHLLHEMLRGEVIEDGWGNPQVAESLEYCLSCKTCQHDCPTQVDMAAYKASFMQQHYAGRRRPLAHYLLGRISDVLPVLAKIPRVVNAGMQFAPLKLLLARVAGISPGCDVPRLATTSFSHWVRRQAVSSDDHFYWFGAAEAQTVILWADSFNAYYRPEILQAALRVLNRCGFRVGVAKQRFCCGRPLYEQGFLQQAQRQLQQLLEGFQAALPAGASVVVLEPSCLAVFRDELLQLLGDDARARDLAQRSVTLIDCLAAAGVQPQRQLGQGILHLHCHHKATAAQARDRDWLQRCFTALLEPESGCCGMAGSFGLRQQTRAVALKIFGKRLAPALLANAEAMVVTNGFSCREQIETEAGRKTLHPVEVVERVL